MIAALLDLGLPADLGPRLRAGGLDAVALAEHPGPLGPPGPARIDAAAAEGRVLVTRNLADHLAPEGGRPEAPLVAVSPVRYPPTPLAAGRLARDLDALLAGGEEITGVRWLTAPPGCPFHWPPGRPPAG